MHVDQNHVKTTAKIQNGPKKKETPIKQMSDGEKKHTDTQFDKMHITWLLKLLALLFYHSNFCVYLSFWRGCWGPKTHSIGIYIKSDQNVLELQFSIEINSVSIQLDHTSNMKVRADPVTPFLSDFLKVFRILWCDLKLKCLAETAVGNLKLAEKSPISNFY